MERIGSTQGIRFRISPPPKAKASAATRPSEAPARRGPRQVDLEAAHRVDDEQAAHAVERAERLRRGGNEKLQRAVAPLKRLACGVLHLALLVGKELQSPHAKLRGRRDLESDAVAGAACLQAPARSGLGQCLARVADLPRPVWRRRVQLKVRLLRNATFRIAHQPLRVRRDARRRPGAGRHADVGEQQHLTLVAVVGKRPDRQLLRHRPLDRPGAVARRQLPVDRSGLARVAGIAPVGMPARDRLQAQGHGKRPAGFRRALGHQLRLHLPGAHRRRLQPAGGGHEENAGQRFAMRKMGSVPIFYNLDSW